MANVSHLCRMTACTAGSPKISNVPRPAWSLWSIGLRRPRDPVKGREGERVEEATGPCEGEGEGEG